MNAQKLLHQADKFLQKKQNRKLKSLLVKQDFHLIAQVINRLTAGKLKTFALLPPEIQAEVVLTLSKHSKQTILPRLSDYTTARFLHFNDEDDAVDILQFLPRQHREKILSKIRQEKRRKIEKLLKFGAETAGGLMDLNFILVKPDFTLKDVAEKVQKHAVREKQTPAVLVVDKEAKVKGFIPYKNLILSSPKTKVSRLLKPLPLISHKTDQEKILQLVSKERSDVVGVIDEKKRILGIIHLQDLLKVVQAEATEDVYRFAGVSREEDVLDPASVAVGKRYKWLVLNLGTAFLASFVISQFEQTIAQMAILAAYMPIVAGMGGNAGTQALAVVVRGLALGEISWHNAKKIIFKETKTGLVNGLIVGAIAASVAFLLNGKALLGFVLGTAMIINLIVAGLFGALIPLTLKALKIDPAIASSVFITAATDVFGFLTFLGLATLILL